MKIKQTKFLILALVGSLVSLFVIFAKISPFHCCGCLPQIYKFQSLMNTFIESPIAWPVECVCHKGSCSPTLYIVPIDLLLISCGLFILAFTDIKIFFLNALLVVFLLTLLGVGLLIPALSFEKVLIYESPKSSSVSELISTAGKRAYQSERAALNFQNLPKDLLGNENSTDLG